MSNFSWDFTISSVEGVPGIKPQVTSVELLNSPSNNIFLVYWDTVKGFLNLPNDWCMIVWFQWTE